eukprot:TRINITY_DN6457_c0_g1_i3.p1 TRINITY_DN6457_c0_g1~~TRINITY_DN6457_c0_g1_i3.p1  ORF type:complete len:308 (-),score=64.17 TRINITY_DN6457_c0_g1_i3:52-975(-)
MAPEVMKQDEFDFSLDVYSFGLILWEIWTGIEPFQDYEDYDEFFIAITIQDQRPPLPTDAPVSFNTLMSSCWCKDRKSRPTFAEVDFRLAEVLVDLDIPNPPAAMWWKKHFLQPTMELQEPSVIHLTRGVLDRETGLSGKNRFSNLKNFLIDPVNPDVASRKAFHQTIQLFGPIYLPQVAGIIAPKMVEVKESEWFWGNISSSESQKLLMVAEEGTFLVRISTTHPDYPFALSFSNGFQAPPSHHRIGKHLLKNGSYSYFCSRYEHESLVQLVDHLIEEFGLVVPLTKTKTSTTTYNDDPLVTEIKS